MAFVVRVVVAGQIVFPKPEDTAYYVGVARNLLEGRGLVSDALWSYGTPPLEFPRQAFEVWLPLPTFLAADPDGAPRARRSRRPSGRRSSSARSCRSSPGGSRPTSRRNAALPVGRARTLAIGTGLVDRGLPAAPAPLGTPRLDDAVRGPRPRRLPAHGPHRRRSARRPAGRPAGHRARACSSASPALTRNEAVFIGLAWVIVAWGIREPRPRDAGPAHRHRRGRGRHRLPALGDPRTGRRSAARSPARR